MDLAAINANNKAYRDSTPEQKEAIVRVQTEFLNQINEGKDKEEAFKESLKAIDKKYNPQKDELCIGSNAYQGYGNIGVKATPAQVKEWLDVVSIAVPIITGIIEFAKNLILELLPEKDNTNGKKEETLKGVA